MPVTHTMAMHGIEASELVGPEVLSYVEISQSAPDAGEVLIKAEAIGVGKSTFDASVDSLAVRGTMALFGASSGPVPPVDPQRLNAAGSVYLTRPSRTHFVRTRDEFAWRTGELSTQLLPASS
jgi:NADPH:quinone reductase-like Zn-dependent oxidoreductase